MYRFLLCVFLMLSGLVAIAGDGSSSAGGDGVLLNGKPYLLDFVETDSHENVHFKDESKFSEQVANHIVDHLGVSQKVANLTAAKLFEVFHKNAALEFIIKRRMFSLDWSIIPLALIGVSDEDLVVSMQDLELIQLAVRQNSRIFISREYWEQLDDKNKVGLIFHEVLYSLSDSFTKNEHNSSSARLLTNMFFHKKFESITALNLAHILLREKFSVGRAPLSLVGNKVIVRKSLSAQLDSSSFIYGLEKSQYGSDEYLLRSLKEVSETTSLFFFEEMTASYRDGGGYSNAFIMFEDRSLKTFLERFNKRLKLIESGDDPEYRLYLVSDIL